MNVFTSLRDLKRIKNIVSVLFKHEFGYFIERLDLKKYLRFNRKIQQAKFSEQTLTPKRFRLAMEELGGSFIKLGQLLSLRPDLLPKEYCEEFFKLQDNVRPLSYRQVKSIIEKEFKQPLRQIFKSLDKHPIASASIGQVHKGKLKSGEKVAVKVQRPNMKELFEADIDIMYKLAGMLEKRVPETKLYRPTQIIKEFEEYTKKELDHSQEAKNIDDFSKVNQNKDIVVPKVFWNYTKQKVLTMEFIDGKKIHNVKKFSDINSYERIVMNNIASSTIKQILEYRIFHADPHPGNILLLWDNKIALLDFGIVGRLDEDLAEKIENVFISLMKPNSSLLANSLIKLNFVDKKVSQIELKKDLSENLSKYYSVSSKEFNLTEAMYSVLAVSRKYEMQFPNDFVLLVKTLITVDGLAKTIYPSFNFIEELKPYTQELIRKKSSTKYLIDSLKKTLLDFKNTFSKAPQEFKKTMRAVQSPKVKVDIEDADVQKFVLELDRSSNRVSFGLIIAALLIGSALMFAAKLPPFVYDLSLVGIIFLIVAIIVSLLLVGSIYREGRFKK
ncbi:MAG: AarF/ABC1/UbiB kinase family protein [Candidatus Nanoarchaeia archaeon]|jgi:ubiquinone biosynthesis protein|nr:AarF/ABC1/UbiB kinase family protein [Candidatus Nanoarchaeia archaeon]|tara:strand:- start:17467 stop:19137 length:1671 start_codon:yes stop_codon:yes gene_type:complete